MGKNDFEETLDKKSVEYCNIYKRPNTEVVVTYCEDE